MNAIRKLTPHEAAQEASRRWTTMLGNHDFPTDEDCTTLIENFQILTSATGSWPTFQASTNHRSTSSSPKRRLRRNDRASSGPNNSSNTPTPSPAPNTQPPSSPPSPTSTSGNGRGSKAHQYLQLALDTDPGYRFARLTDQMLGAGIIAGWNTNKNTAYKTQIDMP
jgi:hypothetical protein